MTCTFIALAASADVASYMLVEKSNMRPLKLYVYNSVSEGCREVQIIPNKAWGGDGRYVPVIPFITSYDSIQPRMQPWVRLSASHSSQQQAQESKSRCLCSVVVIFCRCSPTKSLVCACMRRSVFKMRSGARRWSGHGVAQHSCALATPMSVPF
jgi:hypothetical protein